MKQGDELRSVVEELASLGEKRAGTTAGEIAAERIRARLSRVLPDARFESFRFPRHIVTRSSWAVRCDGAWLMPPPLFDVLEASGSGAVNGPLVDAGAGTVEELRTLGVAGAIAVVRRQSHLHRSTQLLNLARAGARAMVLVSSAPGNLRQVGSVRRSWEALAPIPAIAIGADDGKYLLAQRRVRAHLEVEARWEVATGQNVVGTIRGSEPDEGVVLVGAHYDSWHAGSCDNGAGVAALVALAADLVARPRQRSVRLVAFDGEELALYGGYHHLRHHAAGVVAAIDLETPAAHGSLVRGLACSRHAVLEQALAVAGLGVPFPVNVSMDLVPQMFGGTIPTDIQGWYLSGTPTLATAVDAPHYHTVDDTPDKVDIERLGQVVHRVGRFIDELDRVPRGGFGGVDPTLLRIEAARDQGGLIAHITDAAGRPRAGALVELSFLHDDFVLGFTAEDRTDASGLVRIALPTDAMGPGGARRRFIHLTAGHDHPLAERIIPIEG